MDSKRRLPVLPATPAGDDAPPRPPWQWVGFGALAIFVVWLPLSWLATVAARRGDLGPLAGGLLFAATLVLAALAGGYLVGRWGTRGVGVREATLAGLSAALMATVLAWGTAGLSASALVTVIFAVPPAALGGRLGMKKRAGAW